MKSVLSHSERQKIERDIVRLEQRKVLESSQMGASNIGESDVAQSLTESFYPRSMGVS
jgi:hypothetical protein